MGLTSGLPERTDAPDWADGVYRLFVEQAIGLISFVPDAGLKRLIELCQAEPTMQTVTLTTEEEGIALAAGAFLGGRRSALLMQSSGVGNCSSGPTASGHRGEARRPLAVRRVGVDYWTGWILWTISRQASQGG